MRMIVMAVLALALNASAARLDPVPDPLGLQQPGALALGARALPQTVTRTLLAPGLTHYTVRRGADRSGPWRVDIVAVEPGARGRWSVAAGPGRVRTSDLARAHGALVAINGGFFVEKDVDGYLGQPAGVSVLDGRANSAPVGQRPAVVIAQGRAPAIAASVDWQPALAWSNGARTLVDGINRPVGKVRNCGRADRPVHDYTCTYADDLVYYPPGSPFIGQSTGVRFAITPGGVVRELTEGAAPADGDALLAASGARTAVIRSQGNATVTFASDTHASLVNAGPTLLLHGAPVRQEAQQGWAVDATGDPAHRRLMHSWIDGRHPRTALGVRADGTVLLVTVDGRQPQTSVGLTIEELRRLMASLGAVDAVNLDGGGSTALAIRGQLVNHPSDAAGERKVGDVIMFSLDNE